MQSGSQYEEYPQGYTGRRRYVRAVNHGIVAACYAYTGYDGRNYLRHDPAGIPPLSDLTAPYVVRDIAGYKSTIDGTVITSRSAHREHLKIHDVIEVGNERMKSPRPMVDPEGNLGQSVKLHVDKVAAMPQRQYDAHVAQQAAEHAAISNLVTAQ